MNNTFTTNGNRAYTKDLSSQWAEQTIRHLNSQPMPKVFVVCDRSDTAPVWGYILSQKGLIVILETSLEKASDRWYREMPDIAVIDIDIEHQDPIALYKKFRAISAVPILLFLPTHDEKLILEAYVAGVDEVVVKPISPAIFLAKIIAWMRLSHSVPVDEMSLVNAGQYRLDFARRCLMDPGGLEIKLTNLEFRLLNFLMSRSTHVFSAEDIIEAIWGRYRRGDEVLVTNVVYRLRKKIEADPSHPYHLQSWQGGYSFHP